jgi:hypothetical protein
VLLLAIYSHISFEGVGALYLSAAGLATGPVLYYVLRRMKRQAPVNGNW